MSERNEALLILAKAINKMQGEMKDLKELFEDNVTFIKGMGDVPTAMGEVLMNIVNEHDDSVRFSMQQMMRSSEFYKNTISSIYPKMNIMQEWFSEFAKETIALFTEYDEEYIQDWMILKTQESAMSMNKTTAEMSYDERCVFGESMFYQITKDLGADPMCHYILRTLYIPYVSIYYLRPLTDYPYYKEWKSDIKRYQIMKDVRAEMHDEFPEYEAFHTDFLERLALRVNDPKGLIHNHDNKEV